MFSSLTETLMSSSTPKDAAKRGGANPLRTARSFSRNETRDSAPAMTRPQRASTFQNGAPHPEPRSRQASKAQRYQALEGPDAFESRTSEDASEPPRASIDMDDLPIELISLTDSFIDSLSAKVHPQPPSIDNLSRLFQEFYVSAAAHINTHISSLLSRHTREHSPSSASSARASPASLLRAKAASIGSKDKAKASPSKQQEAEQQMITAEELADRKRARKALEAKRGLLEEAVERRLCEGIYDRIYRHRSTQDEAQDDKLRSKTAALAVVGIGPTDLGVDLGGDPTVEGLAERQEEVKGWLDQARRELVLMNESRYPLGKLNRLKAAHKSIVDTLAHFHPSSSADEIMPMLIYTLITLPPERLNVVSDLNFIQRFRSEPKLVGEAAYCLTNLEAAVSFLETVDLSTLRPDESPSGPVKPSTGGSRPTTPRAETFPPAYSPGLSAPTIAHGAVATATASGTTTATAGGPLKAIPGPSTAAASPSAASSSIPSGLRAAVQLRNRRLSDLVNTPAQALGLASDAVFSTADQSLKNIGNSLGDSYKFLLGKLREQRQDVPASGGSGGVGVGGVGTGPPPLLVVPRTLDDARKLIGTPPPEDDAGSVVSGASSIHSIRDEAEAGPGGGSGGRRVVSRDEKMINLIAGGRKAPQRDHSADSQRSAGSASRRVSALFSGGGGGGGGEEREHPQASAGPGPSPGGGGVGAAGSSGGGGAPTAAGSMAADSSAASNNPALIDSMRSFGNSLNPMSRLSGMGMMRGFGRTATSSPVASHPPQPQGKEGGDLASAFPDIAQALPPKPSPPQIAPPVKKFIEAQTAAELRLGDVGDLLREYRRLAAALKERDAFKEA